MIIQFQIFYGFLIFSLYFFSNDLKIIRIIQIQLIKGISKIVQRKLLNSVHKIPQSLFFFQKSQINVFNFKLLHNIYRQKSMNNKLNQDFYSFIKDPPLLSFQSILDQAQSQQQIFKILQSTSQIDDSKLSDNQILFQIAKQPQDIIQQPVYTPPKQDIFSGIMITTKIVKQNNNFPKLLLNKFFKYINKNGQCFNHKHWEQLHKIYIRLKRNKFQKTNLSDFQQMFVSSKYNKKNRLFLNEFLSRNEFKFDSLLCSNAISEQNKHKYLLGAKLAKLRSRNCYLASRIQTNKQSSQRNK